MNTAARPEVPGGRHLILYDGVCGLCNRIVRFVLPRDPSGIFHFAALQSAVGASILKRHGRRPDALDTFYLVADYRSANPVLYHKARAALFVLRNLGRQWRLLGALGIFPDAVLNAAYDFVAHRRYRVFGRYEVCPLPSPEHRDRFDDAEIDSGGEGS
jgi:predicted DCC family thiol-disulfide oxidoreductase YuxK